MSDEFNQIIAKMEQFERSHMKVMLPERAALIKRQYERLMGELENEADISFCKEQDEMNITIKTDSILTCDEAHSLNFLIGIANYTEMNIVNNKIVIYLWFRLWDWLEKEVK